ncbi:MAG: PAS domain S-box protein [Methanoregula sp.]|nr:PAS domain S-box protein [Methanoregula sp.]
MVCRHRVSITSEQAMYTVLYVDDEPDLLDLARLFLERSPEFCVKTLTSAQAALESPFITTCDVIVSDYQMPEMDGIAFLKAVREQSKTLPFILFTGRGREDVVIEAINNGVDFYLQKGGDVKAQFAELSHKIRMAVERKRAVDERTESEKRFSSIFHASPIHQLITEFSTGKILDINDRFLKDLKLPRNEVIEKTLGEIGFYVDEPRYPVILEQLEREGIVRNAELRVRARNGKTYTTFISMTRVQVHNQDLVYTQSMNITAQKKSQQTINALLNAPPDVSMLLDRAGTLLAVNHAGAVRFAIPEQELIGSNAYELISSDLSELRREMIDRAVTAREPLVYTDDRSGRAYENHLYPIIGSDGEVATIAVYSRDVTDEIHAKQALKESEEKYRLVVEHSHDAIYIYRDNHFLFVNRETEEISGFSHDELMQRELWDFILPDDRERLKVAAAKRFAGGVLSSAFQARILRKNGEVRDAEFFVDIVDYQGKPAILGIARDITEKKRAEGALREREEQLRSLSDNLPSGMVYQIIIDPDGRRHFAHCSAGVERIHEVTVDEVLRDPSVLYNQIEAEDLPRLKAAEDSAVASMSPFSFSARIRTPSGAGRAVLLRSAPRHLPGGGILWDGIELDITSKKLADDELKAAYEQLAASQEELKAQFNELCTGQELLRESEEKYRTLVEHTDDTVFIAQDGNLVFVNNAFSAMSDYTAEDLIGKPFVHLVAPEDRELVLSRHKSRLSGNSLPEVYEFSLLHRNGITRSWVKIRVGTGMYAGRLSTIGTLHDVTDDRMREKALAESEELYRKIVAAIPDIVVRTDIDGTIIFINENGVKISGHTDSTDLIGTSIFSLFAPESLPLALQNTPLMFERPLGPVEYVFRAKDGTRITLEVNGDVLRTPEGLPYGMVFICRDITERRRAEAALVESEENYRRIIENIQDVFYRTDRDGFITMISAYGARLVGFDSADEIIGKYRATDFYADPGERDAFLAYLGREKVVTGYSLTLRDRHGELHNATASSRLLFDAEGQVNGIEGILHDVTHLKRAKNALRQANRQLTLMTSITRHDIRNQLMALRGWLELSRASVSDPGLMLELITKEQWIASIIEEQINFTTFFDEMGVKDPVWFDPVPLIRKSQEALPFKKIRLDIDISGIEIFADPLFEKVFYDLFDNALRYGGDAMTTIRVAVHRVESGILLVIEDDGTGISDNEKELLFNRGFGKNTGFGLFLVKEILTITGMTIRETGIPGKGARFEIRVPAGKYRSVSNGSKSS